MKMQGTVKFAMSDLLQWLQTPACVLNQSDTIVASNQPLADLLRRDPDTLNGIALQNLLIDDTPALVSILAHLEQKENHAEFAASIKLADGQVMSIQIRILSSQDSAQKLVSLMPMNTVISGPLADSERVMLEYHAIMANAPVGIGFSRDRKIVRYNEKFAETFGFQADNGIGLPTTTLYTSEQAFIDVSQRAFPLLSTGQSFEEEMQMRRQDNSVFWAHAVAYLVVPSDPPQGTIWIITDIDKRKAAENKLRDTMLELQAILDSAAVGIIFSRNRQFERCNQRGASIFGYSPRELLGQAAISIYPNVESYERIGREAGPQLAAGAAFRADWQYKKKNGDLIWCRVYGKALDPANTERGTVWIFDDITEARDIQDALKQSLQEMEAIMFNASVGILITRERKITRYNPMFGQMFGLSGETGLGRPASDLFRSEQEYSALGELATPLLSQAKPFQTELFMRSQDGSDLWINLIGYVADAQNTRHATFWILEDRSAFKSAEAALLKAQSDLAQAEKLAALGLLVVGVAHELNTPIGNALTAASTVQERSLEIQNEINAGHLRRSQLDHFLSDMNGLSRLIIQSCERTAQLVIAFKQVAANRHNEQRRAFKLHCIVEQAIALQQQKLAELPGHVECQIACDIATNIICDSYPQALSEVITSLLENALTHAFVGRLRGTLQISASAGEWIEMRFSDDGIGMDAAMLTRIFDPYFTTRLGHGRSGLGLSISRNLSTAVLGGELSVESVLGHGSCFSLRFPRVSTQ